MKKTIRHANGPDGSNPFVAQYRERVGLPLYNEEAIPKRGSTLSLKEERHAANARYGEFILYVLLQPNEELRHKGLSAHAQELFEHTPEQWYAMRVRLELELGIVAFERTGRRYSAATVDVDALRQHIDAPFMRDEIRDILEHMPTSPEAST